MCFAANSLLCRLALRPPGGEEPWVSAHQFASMRLLSAFFSLVCWTYFLRRKEGSTQRVWSRNSVFQGAIYTIYLIPFTLSYQSLDATVGAFLLFGSAQLTIFSMQAAEIKKDWKHLMPSICGAFLAFIGLLLLALRTSGPSAPEANLVYPAFLMIVSGVAWGTYTNLGKRSLYPVVGNRNGFFWAMLFVGGYLLIFSIAYRNEMSPEMTLSPKWKHGVLVAFLSGAICTGIGSVCLYLSISKLGIIARGTAQTSIPLVTVIVCLLYTSPSPRDQRGSRMPSSA